MLTFRGLTKKLLSGGVAVAIMTVIGPVKARAIDKIASNANAIFIKAGGTKKDGMTQMQFQAAENQIDDALDRLARAGVIGGEVPPAAALARDLSLKEIITYTEFVQYFRGLASERDLQLRREMVDQAIAQQGAARAAAEAAWEAARERRVEELLLREEERADRDRDETKRDEGRIRRENEELQRRNQELMWYLQHPRQPLPTPNNKPANTQQAQNGTNPGGSTGELTGGPIGAGRPYNGQRIGTITRPFGVPSASDGRRLTPSASSGSSGSFPPKADRGTSRDDKNSSKDDKKKSDDKSKK
jgi:hypothetical protein